MLNESIVDTLIGAAPELVESDIWRGHLDLWGGDERPLYADLGCVADFIVTVYEAGAAEQLGALFAALDRLLTIGDKRVGDAIAVGVLESVQNIAMNRGLKLGGLRELLGPASKSAWDDLAVAWANLAKHAQAKRRLDSAGGEGILDAGVGDEGIED
jgi:hypothetical protein